MKRVLRISPSMLRKVATCETQAALSTLGYEGPEDNPAADAGGVMHAAIAALLSGSDIVKATEVLKAEYAKRESFARLEADEKLDTAYTLDNLVEIFTEWTLRNEDTLCFKRPVQAELAFNVPFFPTEGTETELIGIFDALYPDGEVEGGDEVPALVLESKGTRERLDDGYKRGFLMDPQTTAYIFAAQLLGYWTEGHVKINSYSMRKLPDSDKRCQKHSAEAGHRITYAYCGHEHLDSELFEVEHNDARVREWEDEAQRLAVQYLRLLRRVTSLGEIKAANQNGKFVRRACVTCDYFKFCLAGRPIDGSYLRRPEGSGATMEHAERHNSGAFRSGLFPVVEGNDGTSNAGGSDER